MAWQKFGIVVACVSVMVGCGDTPVAPTPSTDTLHKIPAATAPSAPAPSPAAPAPTRPAGITVTGPDSQIDAATVPTDGGRVHWVIRGGAWSRQAAIRTAYVIGDAPGYAPAEGPTGLRTQNGHLEWAWGDGNEIHVWFDLHTVSCNRVQVDLSVDEDGQSVTPLGRVINYGRVCEIPPAITACEPFLGQRSVDGGVATFEVLPGGNVELSLVSYSVDPRTVWFLDYVQQFYAGTTHGDTFGPGLHTLRVNVPPVFQSDLLCGGYVPEDLTTANIDDYAPRTVASDSNYWRDR